MDKRPLTCLIGELVNVYKLLTSINILFSQGQYCVDLKVYSAVLF